MSLILTAEESARNEERKQRLFELIDSGNCILMAGSGVTANMYMTWDGLVQKFTEQAKSEEPDFPEREVDEDYAPFFDRVKRAIGERQYYNVIYREFGLKPVRFQSFHRELVDVPFLAMSTTNYDPVLDSALEDSIVSTHSPEQGSAPSIPQPIVIAPGIAPEAILDFLKAMNQPEKSAKGVLHLHGFYTNNVSIVLSEQEYKEKYGFRLLSPELVDEGGDDTWTLHRKLLWALLATRRVLFLGFSINDSYFRKMLDTVARDLSAYNSETHYAVFRITDKNKSRTLEKAKTLRSKYGVESIFYTEDENNKDEGFIDFVRELKNSTGSGKATRENATVVDTTSDVTAPNSDVDLKWLNNTRNEINKGLEDGNQ